MEFFKVGTKIDFMAQRKWAAAFSIVIVLVSIVSLFINKLNLGLDFTGGTQVVVHYEQPADLTAIRQQLNHAGFGQPVVQAYGTTRDVLIRLAPHTGLSQQSLKDKLLYALPGAQLQQLDYIGPQVGKTLVTNGLLAILISLLVTMAYIAFRFEMRFAVSAAVALIHDPILILGIFSLFHLEFDLISLAAVLTIIGYSLNDT